MPVVLDSWAIMRLLDGAEPAASRVQSAIDTGEAVMCWINLGEVAYVLRRARGAEVAEQTVRDIEHVVRAVFPDRTTIMDAAAIKASYQMSYADAFAAATALQLGAPLWTGDPELLVREAPWNTFDPSA